MAAKRPFDILSSNIGQVVTVRLKGSKDFRGKFLGYDPHWNITLEEAEELNGEDVFARLGTIILRGNNVLYVCGVNSK
ncbi:MAG TPA: LSM domain-containing protein [Candidatus Acidoferrales bacterium]|nr:LSM domain-containing protein [Candidatus Acidoferrales bacterium]HYA60792.1 LSM domain-containing protein [Candidatus Acidoferrum sp.]